MALLNYPYTTGFLASHESATFKAAGVPIKGYRSMGWKQELGGEDVYGNGPVPVGRTIGQYKATLDIEQLLSEYTTMVEKLGTYGLTAFNLTVRWREGSRLSSIEIVDVLIKTEEGTSAQGGGAVVMKYSASVIVPIRVNGKSMIDEAVLRGLPISAGLLRLNGG